MGCFWLTIMIMLLLPVSLYFTFHVSKSIFENLIRQFWLINGVSLSFWRDGKSNVVAAFP